MKIMLFLILVSLTVAAGFLLAFLLAAKNGQFDDDYTPSIRILFDDIETTNNEQPTTNNKQRTTNNEQQTTNNEQQTTNNQQRTTK